jgi:protein associated with RNAse G/E
MIVTKEMIVQYFDIDVGECLMTQEDFCEQIAIILNHPIKERKHWLEEITSYYNEREIDIWCERL